MPNDFRESSTNYLCPYKAAGIESKEWMAAPDCCDACQELDGKIIPINESFVAGSYFKDAPLHPHCRCDTLPVVI
ncbi:hypothetical protein EA761_07740 [Acinetobacter pittii]|nr:hypothetical protein EA761_07740 [Acinetobacter pittii]